MKQLSMHMRESFYNEVTEGILLVNAANAFNNLNRKAVLHNRKFIGSALETVLNNTYQSPNWMFVSGAGEGLSSEGFTQGDPLEMVMYALTVILLTDRLQELHSLKQKPTEGGRPASVCIFLSRDGHVCPLSCSIDAGTKQHMPTHLPGMVCR